MAGVLLISALMIMSGRGWVGAQSHTRHADKVKRIFGSNSQLISFYTGCRYSIKYKFQESK